MKHLLLTLSAALSIFSASAQIIIDHTDFQRLTTDTVKMAYNTETGTILSAGNAGANQTWDFSSHPGSFTALSYPWQSSFPPEPAFPQANMRLVSSYSLAYGYAGLFNDGYYDYGAIAFPTENYSASYTTPPLKQYAFPLQYADTFSQQYRQRQPMYMGEAQTDTTQFLVDNQRHVLVDGWGTLITAGGTFDSCLRLLITTSAIDSSFSHDTTTGWHLDTVIDHGTDTNYVWLRKGIGFVASMYKSGFGTSFGLTYLDTTADTATSIIPLSGSKEDVRIYPNPARTQIAIQTSGEVKDIVCIGLNGQVQPASVSSKRVDVSRLSTGIYFLKVVLKDGSVVTKMFMKE